MGKTSKDLFSSLVKSIGYCCPYSFLRANKKLRSGYLASELGLHRRTIAYWREAYRLNRLSLCKNCKKAIFDLSIDEK